MSKNPTAFERLAAKLDATPEEIALAFAQVLTKRVAPWQEAPRFSHRPVVNDPGQRNSTGLINSSAALPRGGDGGSFMPSFSRVLDPSALSQDAGRSSFKKELDEEQRLRKEIRARNVSKLDDRG